MVAKLVEAAYTNRDVQRQSATNRPPRGRRFAGALRVFSQPGQLQSSSETLIAAVVGQVALQDVANLLGLGSVWMTVHRSH